jgi:hypothetical protein
MRGISGFLFAIFVMLMAGGCTGGPHFGDAEGWSASQKRTFERILAHDEYASLCGMENLYTRYLREKDTRILSRLLTGYARNLANSCIDISAFEETQKARRKKKIHTEYRYYLQDVSVSGILSQLRAGKTIEEILHPYVPATSLFAYLLRRYRIGGMSPEQTLKVRMSLERVKLMDPDPEKWKTFFIVNIPEFEVRFFENSSPVLEMGVVVGQKKWQTPVFGADMKYVVLNPTWNVPDNIARAEEIPSLLKKPGYLRRKRMIVLRSYDLDSTPVDPRRVNWRRYLGAEWKKKELPYKLVQLPTKGNALGRVKFMFPNPYSVYMHDTPMKHLFKKNYRAYSHGCIRLSRPMDMLEYLATRGYLNDDWKTVREKLATWKLKYVNLQKPVPVHVGYLTAYADGRGGIRFFPDVYGYDRLMKLKKAP